ncbi:MAG: TIGR01906 family membrane protein, partial [Nanoarchaeota archaeon]
KIPKEIADKETLNLINYLNNKQELTTEFFNEREKLHLQDVKNLIQKTFLIFYIALILFIIMLIYFIYTKNYKIIYSSFLVSTLLLIIILVILSLINFNFLFTQFHLISFSNDYWQLNPETDNLINLFPLQFFQDIIKKIVINIIVTSFIFIIIALVIKFTIKQKVFK